MVYRHTQSHCEHWMFLGNIFSLSRIYLLLLNPKFYYSVHNSESLKSNTVQFSPFHIVASYVDKIRIIIIMSSTIRSLKLSLSLGYLTDMLYMYRRSLRSSVSEEHFTTCPNLSDRPSVLMIQVALLHIGETMEPVITQQQNNVRSSLEDILVQQLIRITLTQKWPKKQLFN
jgi:hypothetical protein